MYADVVVQGPPVKNAVVVPQSAVIRSGERNLTFVDLGEGRFEPREVVLGVKGAGDRIQIVEGVAAGERVVTQAQFMLDSESRIQEAIAQFRQRAKTKGETTEAPTPAGHAH
jgi:multidrug efflux pump subunit AcrA (membrane-fusion protein)